MRIPTWLRGFQRTIGACFLAAILTSHAQAVTVPGTTPGSFAVSPSGAATYTIPIAVPPGINGMQPDLALSYNSQAGNGMLGFGWSLSGLSTITRCPQTMAQDGNRGGVNLDANDRFCLDGQRLMSTGGVYGANGTEYRTEIESFTKVISYGTAGTGPAYFMAWTKSGQILEFGVTADSRIEAQGKVTVLTWALNKIVDAKGNYFAVTYTEDGVNGEYYPARIDYAGNAAAGSVANRSVQFVYTARSGSDLIASYVGGSKTLVSKLLTNIQTYIGTAVTKDYRLSYEISAATKRSRLKSAQACGWDGSCVEALLSTYGDYVSSDFNFSGAGAGYWNGHGGGTSNNVTADFNGDGKADLAGYTGSNGVWHVCFSTGNGFSCQYLAAHGGGTGNNVTADFNGDGKADLAGYTGSNGVWHVCFSTGNGFSCQYLAAHGGGMGNNVTADFNGDGKADLAGYTGSNGVWHVCFSTGNGFSCQYLAAHGGGAGNNVAADFNGDGKADLAGYTGSNGVWHVTLASREQVDSLRSIAQGTVSVVKVIYSALVDTAIYTRDSNAIYPQQDLQNAQYVVSSYTTDNGIGGTNQYSYTYAGAKADLNGRGNLGFRQITATDPQNNAVTTTTYRQDYPYIGMPATVEQRVNGVQVSHVSNTYAVATSNAGRLIPYASRVTTTHTDYSDRSFITQSITDSAAPDSLGNIGSITVTTKNGATGATVATQSSSTSYINDTTNWRLGLPVRTTVTRTSGASSHTSTRGYVYSADASLQKEIVAPASFVPQTSVGTAASFTVGCDTVVTDYGYDVYGNRNRTSVSGGNAACTTPTSVALNTAAATRHSYSDVLNINSATPQIRNTNALGHVETQTIDARFGVATSLTGPNGLTTSWSYDSFGRKTRETRADGTWTQITLCSTLAGVTNPAACSAADIAIPTRAKGYTIVDGSDGSRSITYSDAIGREVRRQSKAYDGRSVFVDTVYNSKGQVAQASKPYFSGATASWAYYTYDVMGRVYAEDTPSPEGGGKRSVSYTTTATGANAVSGLLGHQTQNAKGQITRSYVNHLGQRVRVVDAAGSAQNFDYDAAGNLVKTTDPAGNTIVMAYDQRGRKTAMTDPDMGQWYYAHNALGEMIWQRNAKGQVSTLAYDVLGRMTSRTEADLNSAWTYDTAAFGKGKLATVTADNGYRRAHSYDTNGRPSTVTTTVDTTYSITPAYDAQGRLETVTYPTGFQVKYGYSASNGQFIRTYNPTTGANYWLMSEADAFGNITKAAYGNGQTTVRGYDAASGALQSITTGTLQSFSYSYDAIGNLATRNDQGLLETFGYDSLNRLTGITLSTGINKVITYDALGNILSKPEAGTYSYTGGTCGGGVHAVKSITPTAGGTPWTFCYDANGNMTSGAGRSITYTSFDMPGTITKGSYSTSFLYDADRSRAKQVESNGKTTIYVNPRIDAGIHYEKEIVGTVTTHKHFLYAGSTPIGVYTTKSDGSAPTTRYFHVDHLGSISVITNEAGALLERMCYDPWGKRRNCNGTDDTTNTLEGITTHHGYTGHEHLDDLGLIHMNGRVYDPLIGRFISADPHIDGMYTIQGYNRYTYVSNNPLIYTDPSGYKKFWKQKWFRKATERAMFGWVATTPYVKERMRRSYLLRTVGSIVATVYGGPAGAAAYNMYLTTSVYGGTMADGLKAAAIAGASAYAGNQIKGMTPTGSAADYALRPVAQGVVGGAASSASGGSFEQGFRYGFYAGVAQEGFSAMSRATDRSSAASGNDVRDPRGVLRTDGARPCVGGCSDVFTNHGVAMASEYITIDGVKTAGAHWYNNVSPIRDFIVDVSKVHDYFNSWSYNASGQFVGMGYTGNNVFQVYSFIGMPIAAAYTAVTLPGAVMPIQY